MKKISALILTVLMLFTIAPFNAFAGEEIVTDRSIEYFDDGSYIVTEITENSISAFASGTTTKSKNSYYYDDNNNAQWRVTITGTFNYTGSSATCTKATTSYTIYNDAWKVTSAVPSKSGNRATGTFTVKKYVLGIPVKTVNKTLTITCSNTGVCS